MIVTHVKILVEERSMEEALRSIVPKISSDLSFDIHTFQSKPDLLKNLSERLRGYAQWLPKEWRIMVIVDRDGDDCADLKDRLERAASNADSFRGHGEGAAGFKWSIASPSRNWRRGSLETGMLFAPPIPVWTQTFRERASIAIQTQFRALWSEFLQDAGHFKTGLRKMEAARRIAEHMDPARNCSKSFRAFRDALSEMTS